MKHETEEPFFFENEGSQLFGVLHHPNPEEVEIRKEAVLFCHAFAEEKAVSHRILFEFAMALCRQGYPVLRFDYRGCGDSEGDFNEMSLSSQLSDIRQACNFLLEYPGVDRLCLFGLRLGGTFAALVAEDDPRIRDLVLWEPIIEGQGNLDQFLRLQVMADNKEQGKMGTRQQLLEKMQAHGSIDILGYEISASCFWDLSGVDLMSRVARFSGNIQVLSINKRGRPRKELESLVHVYAGQGAHGQSSTVKDTPFWSDPNNPWREFAFWHGHEALFQRSIDWLNTMNDPESCTEDDLS